MRSFGDRRLARVPGRAGVLAPPALGAGDGVEQLLPAQVLDVAGAEDGVLGDVLHVHVGRRVERAEGPGAPRGGHVDGGQEDVEVLRIGEEDEEARDEGDVQDQEAPSRYRVRSRGSTELNSLADSPCEAKAHQLWS